MAYPDLPLSYESKRSIVNGTVIDQADDGTVWGRNFYSQDVYQFTLIHPLITKAQADSLESFYAANRGKAVLMTYKKDEVDYNVYFISPPKTDRVAGDFWNASSQLIGVKAP